MERILYSIIELNSKDFWKEVGAKFYQRKIIEIGCGDGSVLCKLARENLHTLVIGIELSERSSLMSAGQIKAKKLENAIILNADANQVLENDYLPEKSIDEFHIYFPSPNNVLINNEYIQNLNNKYFVFELHKTLKDNGTVRVISDHKRFFKNFNSQFDRKIWEEIKFVSPFSNIIEGYEVQSNWEYLCIYQGFILNKLQIKKRS